MFPAFPPLVFEPVFRSYLWGGRRLATKLGKILPDEGIWAESWEVVDHPQGQSVVSNGPWQGWSLGKLVSEYRKEILGPSFASSIHGNARPNHFDRFPLLLKYLDCQNVLSVQVHPDDAYGLGMETPDLGKTEAWYIIDAQPGSLLYAGLKEGVSRGDLAQAIAGGTTQECLHSMSPQAGDCIFIPAGTVHALGAGLVVAEIQQSSDCTFRLFDWNRVDATGTPRPLHVEQALDVIDFTKGPVHRMDPRQTESSGVCELVCCDKFRLLRYDQPSSYRLGSSTCMILAVPRGAATVQTRYGQIDLAAGQSALIPQACGEALLVVEKDSTVLVAEPIAAPPQRS